MTPIIELKREGSIMEETHDDVIRQKHIPRVGQTVRSKKYSTLWRVIENWRFTKMGKPIAPNVGVAFSFPDVCETIIPFY